jgi:hypothetical protein
MHPTDAIMMHPMAKIWMKERDSCKKQKPDIDATTGSRLIRMLKDFGGRCFKPIISSENGNALERTSAAIEPG